MIGRISLLVVPAVCVALFGGGRPAWGQGDVDSPATPSTDADESATGTPGVDREPPHQPTTRDTSTGMSAPPGQERGWVEEPGMEPEDAVLLLPRVIFAVPRYVFAGVFWPLRKLLEAIERGHVVAAVERVFYWNEDHTVGWFPIVTFLTREGFSGGVSVFHSDLLGHGERLEVAARFGGRYTQAYEVSFEAERLRGTHGWLETRARYEVNPSLLFAGINAPQSEDCSQPLQSPAETSCPTYFSQQRVLGLLRGGVTFGPRGRQLQVGATAIANARRFGANERDGLTLAAVYSTDAVPGYDDGATTLELDGNLIFDGRLQRGLAGSGVYFEVLGGYAAPLDFFSYWHYAAELAVTFDLYRGNRLLTVRAFVEAVHAEDDEVPFTDLPRLGGPNRLRGYEPAQLRGEVATLGSLEYHYPVHKNVAGTLFVDTGFVAGTYRDVFGDLSRWRVGGGGGLLFGGDDSVAIRLDFSYGDGFHFFFSSDLPHALASRSEQL